jgi:predicted CXXCH cytochrome family protein
MSLRRYAIAMGAVTLASLVGLTTAAGDVPYPDIPRGQGEACVEDTDFMRRNHMSLLMHQRDDTMRKGIRSEQHSLKECLGCHAVPGADSISITVDDPKHFCRSCHDYAAVKIDCFQCHASRPEQEVVAEAREE